MEVNEEKRLHAGGVLDSIEDLVAFRRAYTPSLAKVQPLDLGNFLLPFCVGLWYRDNDGRRER